MQYLIWYNTRKAHRSLNKQPPLKYFLNNFILPQKSNMLWTLTKSTSPKQKREMIVDYRIIEWLRDE
ncbi:hypothetical protein COZ97_04245, partial [bacterium CG_4_8_14_3_um_filter_33_28]